MDLVGKLNPVRRPYDVALSFAGEDRPYVEQVANALKVKGVKVFYDAYEEASLWGKDLYVHLRQIYQNDAYFTVMFISKHYAAKLWTSHERQSAQARAFGESQEYILPVRFDDTDVPGLSPTIGYVDLCRKTPAELAELIQQKLLSTNDIPAPAKHAIAFAGSNNRRPGARRDAGVASDTSVRFSVCTVGEGNVSNFDVLVDPLQYERFGEILDDLFISYLSAHFEPFTYGSQWLITGEPFHTRLQAPWNWVSQPNQPIFRISPEWAAHTPPEELGIVPGTQWQIAALNEESCGVLKRPIAGAYAFGCNDSDLWKIVTSDAKAASLLKKEGHLEQRTLNDCTPENFRHTAVFDDWLNMGSGGALIESGKPLTEELRNYLLNRSY